MPREERTGHDIAPAGERPQRAPHRLPKRAEHVIASMKEANASAAARAADHFCNNLFHQQLIHATCKSSWTFLYDRARPFLGRLLQPMSLSTHVVHQPALHDDQAAQGPQAASRNGHV